MLRNVSSALGPLSGLTRIATRVALGTSACRSSSRFAVTSRLRYWMPVALRPGWAKLATRPVLTGSMPTLKTIGIVAVAALAVEVMRIFAGRGDGGHAPTDNVRYQRRQPIELTVQPVVLNGYIFGPRRIQFRRGPCGRQPQRAVVGCYATVCKRLFNPPL
jgi:hypothetical protein